MPRRSWTPVPLDDGAAQTLERPEPERPDLVSEAVMPPEGDMEPARPVSRASGRRPASHGAAIVPSAAAAATPLTVRLGELDDQLLELIMRHVPTADVGRMCGVCRSWARVAGDERLWHLRTRVDLNAPSRTPWCSTWRETYQDALKVRIGDCVEVRDMYGLWVTGRVMARLDPLRMLVYFEGWSDKWLVWIDRNDDRERIRPLGSVEGDCPGLGSGGPLSAEAFASKCGAVHARLTVERGDSLWPPPSREHLENLPVMYNPVGAASTRVGSRPGSAVRPASARRGPLAWHTSRVDGSISLRIIDAARWQRQQQLLSRRDFRSCREIAAATYAASRQTTDYTQAQQSGPEDEDEVGAKTYATPREEGVKGSLQTSEGPATPTTRANETKLVTPTHCPEEKHAETRTLDSVLLQAPPPVIKASGGEAASRNPYRVGQVLALSLNGMEAAVLPMLRGASTMQPAKLTGRVMVRLDAHVFLVQCEGWRHEGLVWLHAELDAHRIALLGPDGPRGIGDDGPMTAAVFERLQFGIMMLLSQGISYWDAPELLHAQWTKTTTGANVVADPADDWQHQPSHGRGGHIPPSLHSSTFRSSEMVGLGFELASPSARLSLSKSISMRRGSMADSESSEFLPVPITVATAFADGYRREAGLGHEGTADSDSTALESYKQPGRAVGKPPLPLPDLPAAADGSLDSDRLEPESTDATAAAAAAASPRGGRRRTTSATGQTHGQGNPLESGGNFEPSHLTGYAAHRETEQEQEQQQQQHLRRRQGVRRGKVEAHDPNRLALYQHEAAASGSSRRISYGLEIRLSQCEQWRAHQERPPFRTCYQVWGLANAKQAHTLQVAKASVDRGASMARTSRRHTAGGSAQWTLGQGTRGGL